MDGHRFDGLTRALSSGLSRRQILTILGAALTGSGLLAAVPEQAAALSRKARRRCKRGGGTVCSGRKKYGCCATKNGSESTGTCINGACSCDATITFDENNGCPRSADGQCGCFGYPGASGSQGACAAPGGCNVDQPCDSNDDCPAGSTCQSNCPDLGTGSCSFPCIPA